MKTLFVALMTTGLVCAGGAIASDGKQLYDDFRCIGCHGHDGKGAGTSTKYKAAKPIAGMSSQVAYDSIMKMISGGVAAPSHNPDGSCDAPPTQEQVKAISEYVASLPK
jgi:mono/diheme cytochrome c family protein